MRRARGWRVLRFGPKFWFVRVRSLAAVKPTLAGVANDNSPDNWPIAPFPDGWTGS
ncbi:hypothetical protein [Bradyrhizobium guangdongense]|uniref:hypothetical protein n=1 Tax=Bradyrhizobium guangdongense TaxID=1325090 RepID=UPI001642919C|nr:hypothetical protein [Bradyrhizobium guangdongense]